MKLVSINVSLPKTVYHQGRQVNTGIYNEPVAGRVMVRKLNVDGDGQADLKVHGGVYKAVYIYDIENIRYWRKKLGRDDLAYGHFGENFSVEGMPDDRIYIGDIFRIGDVLLEVTQPRVPCFKLEIKMGLPGFSGQFLASGRLGFYCRVIAEGYVEAGDLIARTQLGPEKISVREFARLYYFEPHNWAKIRRIMRIPALPPGWRRAFGKHLKTAGTKGQKRKTPERAWPGFRPFIVLRKVPESHSIASFYLQPEDGEPLPPYLPGQFLTFKLDIPDLPRPVIRTYTLSDGPCHTEYYRITVKREPPPEDSEIISGSNYFHNLVEPGTRLQVAASRGDFFLDPKDDTPVVLLNGGVGMTPMISMLNAIVDAGSKRPVWFVHGTRNGLHHAMREHMRQLTEKYDNIKVHVRYSRPRPEDIQGWDYDSTGHVDMQLLKEFLPDNDKDFYICGPPSFMHSLIKGLWEWDVPEQRIRFEVFGPDALILDGARPVRRQKKKEAEEENYKITFARSQISARWDPESENLLNFAEEQGVFPDFSCRAGICQTCGHELLEGQVDYNFEPLAPPHPGQVLLCCARPKSNLVIDI